MFAINASISAIDSALTTVRDASSAFGTNAAMLGIREDFTQNLVNTLKGGASDLVNADLNEESANLLSLQTRQQLGTISLSIAQKSEQSVLRLFLIALQPFSSSSGGPGSGPPFSFFNAFLVAAP